MNTTTHPFEALGLDERLVAAVIELGFEAPTEIQSRAIPPLLEGRDVIARARTGSGKTAAFGLPLLHRLRDVRRKTTALVVAPTRELAIQVGVALDDYAAKTPLRTVTVYGGAPYGPQLAGLKRGAEVVIGTPGRLIDHIERGTLDLSTVEYVVIDEADELLRMGFIDDVERLITETSEERQVALFSATMPRPIVRVAERYLREPDLIEADVARGTTTDHVTQRAVVVPDRFKLDALLRYLQGEVRGETLIFARTRLGCAELAENLQRQGVVAEALHGDLAQRARTAILNRFRDGRVNIVVATDVAARGLDVENITHVVNFDLPDNPEIYTHRIGRTGRAGRSGTALTIVSPRHQGRLRWMHRTLGVKLDEYRLPTDAAISARGRKRVTEDLSTTTGKAASWLEELIESGSDPADIAASALELLARDRGIRIGDEVSDELPHWATSRPQRRERSDRFDRSDRSDRGPSQRNQGSRRNGPRPDGINEVQVFVGTGLRFGTRIGDVVGALTAETGLAGHELGKIRMGDKVTFVGMSRESAKTALDGRSSIQVRGRDVKLAMARPGSEPRPEAGGPPRRDREQRKGYERGKHRSKRGAGKKPHRGQ